MLLLVITIPKKKSQSVQKENVLKVGYFQFPSPPSLCAACYLFCKTNTHVGDVPFLLFVFQESPPFLANEVFEWSHMLPNHSCNTNVFLNGLICCQTILKILLFFWMAPYAAKPFLPVFWMAHSWSTIYCFSRILAPSALC